MSGCLRMRFFAFVSLILCLRLVHTYNCSVDEFKSSRTGLCCKLCKPGEYMSEECVQGKDTACQTCSKNEFTSTSNNLTSCTKCTSVTCDGGRIMVQSCTTTSDIKCQCPANKYWNTHTLRCEKCTECSRGEKVISPCATYKDAECEQCPEGTYLDKVNNKCVLCSYCHRGQVVEEECTIWADTVCGRVQICVTTSSSQEANPPTLSTPTNLTPEPKLPSSRATEREMQKDHVGKIPNSCESRTFPDSVTWVLIVLVILLLFVVLFLSLSRIKKDTKTPTPHAGSAVQKASVVSNLKYSETIKENNIRFNTLSAGVTEDLATYLNAKQGKNWKHLAGLMGFSSVFTQNLELTPLEATQRLLYEWGQGIDTTVYKLYCFLLELGRDDALAVLLPFLTKQKGSEVIV